MVHHRGRLDNATMTSGGKAWRCDDEDEDGANSGSVLSRGAR